VERSGLVAEVGAGAPGEQDGADGGADDGMDEGDDDDE